MTVLEIIIASAWLYMPPRYNTSCIDLFLLSSSFLNVTLANVQKWVPYSQRYLVLGLVGLVGLGLPLL